MTHHPNTKDTREQDARKKAEWQDAVAKAEEQLGFRHHGDPSKPHGQSNPNGCPLCRLAQALLTARKAGAEAMKERGVASIKDAMDKQRNNFNNKKLPMQIEEGYTAALSAIEGINVDEA